jgi:hypothetical protein
MYNLFMINFTKIFSLNHVLAAPDEWAGQEEGVATIFGFEDLYKNILQVIITLAGLTFFAMLIVGGFNYLTSGGDAKKVAAASSTLGTAVIGIIGVIISWLILFFIESFTGIKVTEFKIITN